ncbi:hypothetical protein [Spirosoma aureum]|nr:hypothetical protein [Spirosoma aureum]
MKQSTVVTQTQLSQLIDADWGYFSAFSEAILPEESIRNLY